MVPRYLASHRPGDPRRPTVQLAPVRLARGTGPTPFFTQCPVCEQWAPNHHILCPRQDMVLRTDMPLPSAKDR